MKTRHADCPTYVTRDGSLIRELMHPTVHGNRAQSLAEATVAAGARTQRHRHARSEELYHVSSGSGTLYLGEAIIPLAPGDTALIPPGTPHHLVADASGELRLLCCCSPAYAHDDTELLE